MIEIVEAVSPKPLLSKAFCNLKLLDGTGLKQGLSGQMLRWAAMPKDEANARAVLYYQSQTATAEADLDEKIDIILEAEHHYPAGTLYQVTWSGKSRSVAFLGDVPTLYVSHLCLWQPHQQGAPVRTPPIVKAMEDCRSPADFLSVLAGCFSAHLKGLARHSGSTNVVPERPKGFWAEAHQEAKACATFGEAAIVRKCQDLAKKILTNGVECIVLAIDEAGTICGDSKTGNERFQNLLDALTVLEGRVFGVFLDTLSMVRGFTPAESHGLAGGPQGRFTKLFRPIFCLPTSGIFDVLAELATLLVGAPPSRGERGMKWNIFRMHFLSKVAHAAVTISSLETATTAAERWALLEPPFAPLKRALCVGTAPKRQDVLGRQEDEESRLALTSIRCGMLSLDRADPDSCIAMRLAAIVGISDDNFTITARYVADPMLGAAAAMEMATEGCLALLMSNLLEMLLSGGASSIFSAGDAGEFVASVLLTAAYDRAFASSLSPGVEHMLPGVPISVSAFLEALLGSDASLQVAVWPRRGPLFLLSPDAGGLRRRQQGVALRRLPLPRRDNLEERHLWGRPYPPHGKGQQGDQIHGGAGHQRHGRNFSSSEELGAGLYRALKDYKSL